MINLVSNAEMRQMDQRAITEFGIPGIVLMENAGRNSAEAILEKCDELQIYNVCIVAGKGNNGGDGFVIARYLEKNGFDIALYLAGKVNALQGDALINARICLNSGIEIKEIDSVKQLRLNTHDSVIVDALLGTGIKGAASGLTAEIINWINRQETYVFAIDTPSGVNADFTLLNGPTVKADTTLTMGLPKLSHYFPPVKAVVGQLEIVDIGFPLQVEEDPESAIVIMDDSDFSLERPEDNLHKHSAGRVLVAGGSTGMTGAVTLAAEGATLAGAGLVTCAIADSLNPVIENKLTEQMSFALPEITGGVLGEKAASALKSKIEWCDVLVLGPGLGRHKQSALFVEKTLRQASALNKKIIIDADGLFFISENPDLLKILKPTTLLTPHYGEFQRLAPNLKNILKEQPWQALQKYSGSFKGIVNLKGAPSVVGAKEGLFVNPTGNPGLAKGGSGDLLSGLIAGLAASGMELLEAAVTANYIHGKAADYAAGKKGIRSFTLANLMEEVQHVFKELYE